MKVKFLKVKGEVETTTDQLSQAGGYSIVSQDGDIAMITVSDDVATALHQQGVAPENDAPSSKKAKLVWKVQIS